MNALSRRVLALAAQLECVEQQQNLLRAIASEKWELQARIHRVTPEGLGTASREVVLKLESLFTQHVAHWPFEAVALALEKEADQVVAELRALVRGAGDT